MSTEPDKVEARLRQLFSGHRGKPARADDTPESGTPPVTEGRAGGGEAQQRAPQLLDTPEVPVGASRLSAARPRRRKPVQLTLAQLEGSPVEEDEETLRVIRFAVGDADFGIALSAVREVQRVATLTPVPGAMPSLLGLMNLRGAVVPVFDVGGILGRAPTVPGHQTWVLVFGDSEETSLGLLVDGIHGTDRLQLPLSDPPPDEALPLAEGSGQTADGRHVTVLSVGGVLEIGARR